MRTTQFIRPKTTDSNNYVITFTKVLGEIAEEEKENKASREFTFVEEDSIAKHLIATLYNVRPTLFDHRKQETTTLLTRKPKEKSTRADYDLLYVIKTFMRQIRVSEDIKHIKTIAVKSSSNNNSEDLLKHLKSSSLTYDKALIYFTE